MTASTDTKERLPDDEAAALAELAEVSRRILRREKAQAVDQDRQTRLIVHLAATWQTPDRALMAATRRTRAAIADKLKRAGVRRRGA